MESILKIATNELKVREFPGPENNPRILKYARDIGMNWVQDDETPWCSIFLNWVAFKAKFERSKKANAKSWLDIGINVDIPEPGDIVVYTRGDINGSLGHVGIFLGYSKDTKRIYTLGGNQGNSVSISAYTTDRLIEFRRIRELNIRISTAILKRCDKGPKVTDLQDKLKMAGFDCGTSDGFFGPLTENAVKKFQRTFAINEDGIFNAITRSKLKTLLKI